MKSLPGISPKATTQLGDWSQNLGLVCSGTMGTTVMGTGKVLL